MISGTGMRPGDILTASNGKTIEVISPSHRLQIVVLVRPAHLRIGYIYLH